MKKHFFSRLCIIFSLFLFAAATIVITVTSAYTIYNSDDFAHAYEVGIENPSFLENIGTAFHLVKDFWQTTGGVYLSYFLMMFLSPLNNGGSGQLRVIMIVSALFFLISAGCFLREMFKRQEERRWKYMILMGMCFWAFCNYKAWPEVFFWFSGAMGYGIPMGCMLGMFASFQCWSTTHKKRWYYLTIVLGFFAMGGNLVIAFVAGYFLFFEACKKIIHRSINCREIILFILLFCFFSINGFAPGNFARSEGYQSALEGNPFVLAILYSGRTFVVETERFFKDTGFLVIIIIAFLIGYSNERNDANNKFKQALFFLSIAIVAVFPAALGYKSPYMPNRVLFVSDFFLIFGYLSLSYQFGRWAIDISNKSISRDKHMYVLAGIAVFSICCLMQYRIEDGVVYKLTKSLVTKEIPNYYSGVMETLDRIDNDSRQNIVIDGLPDDVECYMNFLLSEEPDYFANKELAAYYGKESIKKN